MSERRIKRKSKEFWVEYLKVLPSVQETFCTKSMTPIEDSYRIDLRRGDFTGNFDDYEEWCQYKAKLLSTLDAQSQFQVKPTVQNGFSVRLKIPASPQATKNHFKESFIPSRMRKITPATKFEQPSSTPISSNTSVPCVDLSVDLTLTSDEEEERGVKEPAAKKESSFLSKIIDRVKQVTSSFPPTKRFDELTHLKEKRIKSWISKDKSRSKNILGGVIPDSDDLPTLLPEAKQLLESHWSIWSRESIVTEIGDIQLTHGDLRRFMGREWLNDECINCYLQLIQLNHPEIHTFNTFFYLNLSRRGYESVQRWSRRFDLFSKSLVLIPVHLGMHWTMACIDLLKKEILYLDSFHAANNSCLNNLWSYMEQEHQDKKGCPWDSTGWKAFAMTQGVPKQLNGYDCGVFTCVFGEFLARRVPFTFSQRDMPYFRYKLSYELITKQLIN